MGIFTPSLYGSGGPPPGSTATRMASLPAWLGGGEYNIGQDTNQVIKSPRGYGSVETQEGYQRDHIFPVSLGGSSNNFNIKLTPQVEADHKDRVLAYADELHKAGKISLAEARNMVLNWRNVDIPGQSAYDKRFGGPQNLASNLLKSIPGTVGKLFGGAANAVKQYFTGPNQPGGTPFDATGFGQTVNTVEAIPGEIKNLGRDIVQGIFRSVGKTGLSILQAENEKIFHNEALGNVLAKGIDPSKDFIGRFLFGDKPLRPLANEIADQELEIRYNPFAQKFGFDKAALPLAFAGSIIGTGLDLLPFGGSEKQALKQLAKTTDKTLIVKLLGKLGIAEDIAVKVAPELAKISDTAEMKDALAVIKHSNALDKVASKISVFDKFAEEAKKYNNVEEFAQSLKKSTWGDYHTIEMDVPVNKLVGQEPTTAYSKTVKDLDREITELVEVVYDPKLNEWQLLDGNHRVAQARANGLETVRARVGIIEDILNKNGEVTGNISYLDDQLDNFYNEAVGGAAKVGDIETLRQQANADWKANFGKEHEALYKEASAVADQLKTATPEEKAALTEQLQQLSDHQVKLENEFKAKWSQEGIDLRPTVSEEVPFSDAMPATKELTTGQALLDKTGEIRTPSEILGNLPKAEGDSLKPILQETFNTVKSKVHALDYFATPEFVLEKIGLGKESKMLHVAYDSFKKEVKTEIGRLVNWREEVAGIPDASKNIFKFLDGQKVELTATEQKVAAEMKDYLSQWADRLKLPKDNRIANYITHIFERDFIQKEFDPDLAKLITDKIPGSVYDPFLQERLGKLGYREDVFAALDAYVKRATRKVNMDPALEALKVAGERLDIESYNYVVRLASRVNLRPTEMDNLLDNFIKSATGYRFGQRPITLLTTKLRAAIYRGTLGLNFGSALRNLTQGANTYAKLGEKYSVVGYTKLFSRMVTNNLDELYEHGVLDDTLIQDQRLGVYKSLLQKMDSGLFYMFELAEKINRGAAYFGAKSKAVAGKLSEKEFNWLADEQKGLTRSISDALGEAEGTFKYIENGKVKYHISQEDAIKYAKRVVRQTQFAFGNVDSPVIMSSDLIKTIFQLQTYNIKQIEFLKNMAKNKEFVGLLRWTVASLGMVYTVGRLFGMKPKDLIPSVGLGGSPLGTAIGTMIGLVSGDEKKRAAAQGNIGRVISTIVPGGAQIRKTYQGIKAYNAGKDVTPAGKTRYKIPKTTENLLRASIFGKSSLPQAQEYYDSIGEKKTPAKVKAGSAPIFGNSFK